MRSPLTGDQVWALVAPWRDSEIEHLVAIFFQCENTDVLVQHVAEGDAVQVEATWQQIFKIGFKNLAKGVVLVHNHPSGNLGPSEADLKFTRFVRFRGNELAIDVYDHVIVGRYQDGYYSFLEDGRI